MTSAELNKAFVYIAEHASEHFPFFVVTMDRSYEMRWFHRLIAEKCQQLYEGSIKKLMVFMPPQHGKALSVDTPVYTANRGFVSHGELIHGDVVFSPQGTPVRVLNTTTHYLHPCEKITFADGTTLIASVNHEWGCYIPNSDHKPIFHPRIETQAIMTCRYDRSPYITTNKSLHNAPLDFDIDPYHLGVWLGDGCSDNKRMTKGASDVAFFTALGATIVGGDKNGCNVFHFADINSHSLRSLNLLNNKHIPPIYFRGSEAQRRELLCGLMDTDGTCNRRGTCEIVQIREQLSNDIAFLLRTLGYKPSIYVSDAKLYGRVVSKKYRICFNPDRDDLVFHLPRKAERLTKKCMSDRADKYKHFISSIEPCGEKLVNCIQVEGGYYLVGNELIATHNSQLISRMFPAWVLGRNPDTKIVGTSNSAELAQQFSRSIQRIMDSEEYKAVFPHTYLNGTNSRNMVRGYLRNIDIFEPVGHKGFYKAVGVGGSLTGTPADIAIIDDPVKDAVEAQSVTFRNRVWEWYNSVLTTRLHNDSKQLFVMTRWHEDDLAGRILKTDGDQWDVVSIPAIAEVDDEHRRVGEALWEEKHSLDELEKQRARSPRNFEALFQQHPSVVGGNIVKRDWFEVVSQNDFNAIKPSNVRVQFYLDTAYNKKSATMDNDPSGILGAVCINGTMYITCCQKFFKEMPELLHYLPLYCKANGYALGSKLSVEPKANGLSVIQMLRDNTGLVVVRTPTPTESKSTRLNVCAPMVECGRVKLLEGQWNEEFLNEVCAFPQAPHDEYVDVLCYAIMDLLGGAGAMDLKFLSTVSLF